MEQDNPGKRLNHFELFLLFKVSKVVWCTVSVCSVLTRRWAFISQASKCFLARSSERWFMQRKVLPEVASAARTLKVMFFLYWHFSWDFGFLEAMIVFWYLKELPMLVTCASAFLLLNKCLLQTSLPDRVMIDLCGSLSFLYFLFQKGQNDNAF